MEEMSHSINWKELKAYHYALLRLQPLLRGKLVYIPMDNTCSVHYVNAGTGRIANLCELAKSIRLEEARLSVESVAYTFRACRTLPLMHYPAYN